jgi:spore maturation protein CgeB
VTGTVLVIGGTQATTSDLHLLFHRAFQRLGWRSRFLSNDSHLPPGEKVLQQSQLRFSRLHFALFNRRVRREATASRPDLVFITGSNWYVSPQTIAWLQRRGARVVLNEQHLQVFRPYQAEALRLYDHVFTQDSALTSILSYASPARGVSLLGPACDPQDHRPLALSAEERTAFGAQVCYLGYAYPHRIAMFEGLTDLDLRLWGVGWERSARLDPFFRREAVHGLKKTRIYNATAVNVNIQSQNYQIDGITCRPFEVAACGGFCLSEGRRDLARFFTEGEEVVSFAGAEDLRAKVLYYLAHPDERLELARRARERVLREHTYEHRVRQVLDTLGIA